MPPDRLVPNLKGAFGQLGRIGEEILETGVGAIRYRETSGRSPRSVVFVARHHDVVQVLTDEETFSVCHYDTLYSAIAPEVGGHRACFLMRVPGAERTERKAILDAAKAATPWWDVDPRDRRRTARACVATLLAAFAARKRHRFDLIGEFGFFAPYLIANRIFGLPGPRQFRILPRLICLANSLPLGRTFGRDDGPALTQLVWSELVLGQLFVNFEDRNPVLRWLARRGLAALRRHIKVRVASPLPFPPGEPTLLSALLSPEVSSRFERRCVTPYGEHVVSLMIELVGTAMVVPGQAFTAVVNRWLEAGVGFGDLKLMADTDVDDFVDEQLRLAPPADHLLRNALHDTELGGLTVKQDEYVCALVGAAGKDVCDANRLVCGRPQEDYVHFGPNAGPHHCFGRPIAHAMLAEMFIGLRGLPNLTAQQGAITDLGHQGIIPGRLKVSF
ncbi:MAG TPA: hypothetical protein VIC25_08805 [Caulobacteraceae bacterium]